MMNSQFSNDEWLLDPSKPKTPDQIKLLRQREQTLRAEMRMWEEDFAKHIDECPHCDEEEELYCSRGRNLMLALQKCEIQVMQATVPRMMSEGPRGSDKIVAREERNKQKFEQHNQKKIRRRKSK